MKLAAFLILAVALVAAKSEKKGEVVELSGETFRPVTSVGAGTADHPDWFVKFYVPWCPHCQRIEGVWKEVAAELNGEIAVGAVDCTTNRPLKDSFAVRGYPTILFMHEGKVHKYQGDRSKEDFVKFARGGWKAVAGVNAPVF